MDSSKNQIQIGYSSRLFANGLESIIDGFDNFRVVNSTSVGAKLKKVLENNGSTDLLLLEVNHPGERDLNYIKLLLEEQSYLKILLLSHLPNRRMTNDLLESGISGYLLKSCSREDLLSALIKISEDKPYFCSDITKTLLAGYKLKHRLVDQSLTERETDILSLLVQGHTNKSVSLELKITENTVKTHRRNIQKKFGVNNLLGMVRFACRENLVDFGCAEFCTNCPYVN